MGRPDLVVLPPVLFIGPSFSAWVEVVGAIAGAIRVEACTRARCMVGRMEVSKIMLMKDDEGDVVDIV